MISFKGYLFLLEDRAEKTLNWLKDHHEKNHERFGTDELYRHDDSMFNHIMSKHPGHIDGHTGMIRYTKEGNDFKETPVHHDIIHALGEMDPSPDKSHTQWLHTNWMNNIFKHEDHPRITHALHTFMNNKMKLGNTRTPDGKKGSDINSFKTIHDLEDHLHEYLGEKKSKKAEEREIKHAGADLIHSEGGLTVHKLKTKEAACLYGKGTRWCTAAENHNAFDQYHRRGPLYVVQTPDKRKYQFHFQSGQFMDEKDRPENLAGLVSKHPQLKNVSDFKNHGMNSFAFLHDHEKVDWAKKNMHSDDFSIREMAADHGDKSVHDHLIKDEHHFVRLRIALRGGKEHALKLLNDPMASIRSEADRNLVVNHNHHEPLINMMHPIIRDNMHTPDGKVMHAQELFDRHQTATNGIKRERGHLETVQKHPDIYGSDGTQAQEKEVKYQESVRDRARAEFAQHHGHLGADLATETHSSLNSKLKKYYSKKKE